MDPQCAKNIVEAALLCSVEPIATNVLLRLFNGNLDKSALICLLEDLKQDWRHKGLELVQVKTGWRFQTQQHVKQYLEQINPEKPPKYSRATMETLAIIAYKQPVTRGDIESIRGVVVSSQLMKMLENRGWIESIGCREAPGRPALWATTSQFLVDLNLSDLSDLPMLANEKDQQLSNELQKVIPFELSDSNKAAEHP